MARHRADWSELYPELLTTISNRLETRLDFLHFRSVCKKWRSSIPHIPQNLPLLSPLFPFKPSIPSQIPQPCFLNSKNPFSFNCNSTFLINPNPNANRRKPWLISVEESNPGKFMLRMPLTRRKIDEFPENFPRVLNLSDYTVKEMCRSYNYRYDEPDCYVSNDNKLVMFFDPRIEFPSRDDCHALVLHGSGNLLCMRLNDVEDYGYLRHSRVGCFDDIVVYEGRVWVIDRKGRVYVIHYGDDLRMGVFSREGVSTGYVGDTRKRLVESSEGLYLIQRYHYDELIKFRVYKLNVRERKWDEVKSLDGRVLFVSTDCCFFGSTEDFPGFRGDSILFPKGHFRVYSGGIYPDEFYFKGARKELEIGVFRLDDGESGLVSTYPGYSNVFWPPPKWLFSDASSLEWRDGEEEESALDVSCIGDTFPPTLSSEPETQASENPSTLNDPDQFLGSNAPWSELPSNLMSEIAKYLKTRIDVCQFRAVCRKWRAATPAPSSSNLLSLLLPHRISTTTAPFLNSSSTSSRPFTLVATAVYLLQPCNQSLIPAKSWLVTVEELNPGKLFLRLPLRRVAVKELPESFPRVLSLSHVRVSEIGLEYNFRYSNCPWGMFSLFRGTSFSSSHHKVVLFSDNACSSNTVDNTTALVLYDRGKLVSFRLRDEVWLPIRYGAVTNFDDIVNFRGKIYAIDRKGRVYTISCNACVISRITGDAMGRGSGPDRHKRLVESSGELYLVVRHSPDDKIYFRVYRLNEELHKWDEAGNLGDKIFFVTPTSCFVASARGFPGWKGNCVVFPPDCLPTYSGSSYPDWRFFRRTTTELEIGVFHLEDSDGAKLVKCYPGYSDLFWPPPEWLQQFACSPRQLDVSCQSSPEEKDSRSSKFAVEGQVIEDSEISAQQGQIAKLDPASALDSLVEGSESEASTINILGIDIRSELVPTMQKIRIKYGNITKEMAVCSPGIIVKAVESLAEAVLILKCSTGRSLDQSQADLLSATLSDLQLMKFRVDWLEPFVERALLACQRNKALLDCLSTIEKMKTALKETKSQACQVEHKLDEKTRSSINIKYVEILQSLDEEARSVTDMLNSLEPIDLDECLGKGLC